MRRLAAVAAFVSAAFLLVGCSSSSHGTTPAGGAGGTSGMSSMSSSSAMPMAANTIVIKNFMFAPMTLTVSPGATVSVTNDDTVAHTLTATGNKAFDTGDVAPGKTVTFTAPGAAGSYSYICSIHQYMQGTLIVK